MKKGFLFCVLILVLIIIFTGCVSDDDPEILEESEEIKEDVMDMGDNSVDLIDAAKTLNGKVITGYQGWFGTPDDGFHERGWMHWNWEEPTNKGGKQSVTFEMFPDLREYNPDKLSKIDFDAFPDGRPAALFSSYCEETVDLHFRWMQDYGIDGVALQRFLGEAVGWRSLHADTVASHVKKACEKYGRIFYICYDFSGYDNDDFVNAVKRDFERTVENRLALTGSGNYLHHDGKPVVQLWGMGVNGNYRRSPEESLEVIKFFKDKGYYVIGGVPTDWRIDSGDGIRGFRDVYAEFDMISPWTVGRFGNSSEARTHYRSKIARDISYIQDTGQDYMPVIFPGFAWSLWNGGARNMISRRSGEFLKTQMQLAADMSPTAVYIAMFDEYDEATAIMKAASDSSEIPKNSYFLTTSADGIYLSSDYYLRLAGAFTESFKRGAKGDDLGLDIAYSAGPVWFKSGFEKDMDAQAKANDIAKIIETEYVLSGRYALSVNSIEAFEIELVSDLDILVSENTIFSCQMYIVDMANKLDIVFYFDDGDKEYLPLVTAAAKPMLLFEPAQPLGQFAGRRIIAFGLSGERVSHLFLDDICIEEK